MEIQNAQENYSDRNPELTLLEGDCLELMNSIQDNSVDMVLCDLPYGMTNNEWDKALPLDLLWEQYRRICKPSAAIVLNAQEPFTTDLIQSNRKGFKYKWTWYKRQCTGFLNAKKQPLRNCEDVVVFYQKQCTFNPIMRKGRAQVKASGCPTNNYGKFEYIPHVSDNYYPTLLIDIPAQRYKNGHPTQKPAELCEYLIRTYTNPGDTVLDNCMGSGTTGVAAVNTGRNFIGIELNHDYFEMAKKRIQEGLIKHAET